MMKNKYILSALVLNIFTLVIASEKPVKKQEKFDQMKSLDEYINGLRKEKLQKNSSASSGVDLSHGGKYVPVASNDTQDKRFGRGSSGNSKL